MDAFSLEVTASILIFHPFSNGATLKGNKYFPLRVEPICWAGFIPQRTTREILIIVLFF